MTAAPCVCPMFVTYSFAIRYCKCCAGIRGPITRQADLVQALQSPQLAQIGAGELAATHVRQGVVLSTMQAAIQMVHVFIVVSDSYVCRGSSRVGRNKCAE